MLRIKILIACILICILGGGGYILSRQTPPETITIYKATPYEPSPKTEVRNQTPKSDLSNSPLDAFSETASTNDLPEQEEALNIDPVDVTQPLDFSESMGDTEVSTDSPDYGESPFGYGPYPEVPADYPWQPIWTLSDELRAHYSQAHPEGERAIELMQRVGLTALRPKVRRAVKKDNQIADLQKQLEKAEMRETALIDEKSKLLDLLSAEKDEKRALMPPVDAKPKRRNWLLRLVGAR